MELIKPFRGIRPQQQYAQQVVAPPYDVLDRDEAYQLAHDKPHSFLHIAKPEIDLARDVDAYSAEVYQRGAENFQQFLAKQIIAADQTASYYLYQIETDKLLQTGIVAAISATAYQADKIRKHELTRPEKELDRVNLIKAMDAQISPVLLAFRSNQRIDALLDELQQTDMAYQVKDDAGVIHRLWAINDTSRIQQISQLFNALDCLYIADGHHRSAAATSLNQDFLGVIFPEHQLQILNYNRIIRTIDSMPISDLLGAIAKTFTIKKVDQAVQPHAAREFGLYCEKQWYSLTFHGQIDESDAKAGLPVTILHDHLIAPLLGITDIRKDKRIDFVGGGRGVQELQRVVDNGSAVLAFSLYATTMKQLLAIADQQQIMPPKSTWFEPKLVDGLIAMVNKN